MIKLFKQKPYKHLEFGNKAFIADFYVDKDRADVKYNYLHIQTPNNVFEQRVTGYPYGYLLAAVEQGREEEVHFYCVLLWRISQEVYQDIDLANDILRTFDKYDKRLEKQAKKDAATVSKAEEEANTAFMNDIVSETHMKKKELKAKRKADKQAMREILKEKKHHDTVQKSE